MAHENIDLVAKNASHKYLVWGKASFVLQLQDLVFINLFILFLLLLLLFLFGFDCNKQKLDLKLGNKYY